MDDVTDSATRPVSVNEALVTSDCLDGLSEVVCETATEVSALGTIISLKLCDVSPCVSCNANNESGIAVSNFIPASMAKTGDGFVIPGSKLF